MSPTRIIMTVVLAALCLPVSADIIHVPDDFPTIQEAINASVDGDEIVVSPGIYVEQIDFLDKDIIVRSEDPSDPDVVGATIIDGENDPEDPGYPQNPGTLVTLSRGVLTGLTITRGYGDSGAMNDNAGGVFATDSAVITRNVISTNFAPRNGGGIQAEDQTVVTGNRIAQNRCDGRGGGAWLIGDVVFSENVVEHNEAIVLDAGGVYATVNVKVSDCVIDGNFANADGGGVMLLEDAVLEECTISDNVGGGVMALQRSVVRNNLITGNTGIAALELGGDVNESEILVTGNLIIDNAATGVKALGNDLIWNNVISRNVGSIGGASLCGSVVFANNTVLSNAGDVIGGISCDCNATIVNNIIAFTIGGGGILKPPSFTGLEDYNCVFGNIGGDYNDANGADDTPGPHDINEDPRLALLDHHLLSDSPCIDAGLIDLDFQALTSGDIDADRRLQSCNIDIGADEFSGPFTTVLSVASSLPTGEILINLADCNGLATGVGSFNRTYTVPFLVTLTAADPDGFVRWVINGNDRPEGETSVIVNMGTDNFASAMYSIINVPGDSPTIQEAIDAAEEGTTIIVSEGTYVEDLDFRDKSITLRSSDPLNWDVVAATVIDGSTPTFQIETVLLSQGEIAGFTIRDGTRGVTASGTSTVRRCIITGNADKGGIDAQDNAVIANNIITFNGSDSLGGGLIAGLFVTVIDNVIAFNSAETWGGGIYVASVSGTITGNTIIANAALDSGGGVSVRAIEHEHPFIANNIIAFSTFGGGVDADFNALMDFNCVFGNTGGEYVGPLGRGSNDINEDPQLDVDGAHLLPTSPCINAGDPRFVALPDQTDIDGDPRVLGGRVDIGADEIGAAGDLDGDGDVDTADLVLLLGAWGPCDDCNDCPADLDDDCVVGAADLVILLGNWGSA